MPPVGPPQPFQGLYLQLQGAGGGNQYVHYYFWKDGRVCWGLPTGGLDREPADFGAVQQHTEKCGTYRVSGNQMELQLGNDAAYQASLANRRGDSFEMNQYTTAKVSNFGSGKALSGTYTASTYVGNELYKLAYVFQSNGSYTFTRQPVIRGTAQRFTGSYRLFGNTLELTGADAPKRTAYPFPNGDIMIDGGVFTSK